MDLSLWSDQYISNKIDYLRRQIRELPRTSIITHNGYKRIRILDTNPYSEISIKKDKGKELLAKHNQREALETKLGCYLTEMMYLLNALERMHLINIKQKL